MLHVTCQYWYNRVRILIIRVSQFNMQQVKDCSSSQSYLFYMYAWQLDCGCFCICRKRETQFKCQRFESVQRSKKRFKRFRSAGFSNILEKIAGKETKIVLAFSFAHLRLFIRVIVYLTRIPLKMLTFCNNHQIHLTLTALIAARHRAADICCTAATVGYGYNSPFWNKYTNKRKYFSSFFRDFLRNGSKTREFLKDSFFLGLSIPYTLLKFRYLNRRHTYIEYILNYFRNVDIKQERGF